MEFEAAVTPAQQIQPSAGRLCKPLGKQRYNLYP
jgi:hypothetical protein